MRLLAFIGIGLLTMACVPQAGDDYEGEPLAQLAGSTFGDPGNGNADFDAALIWLKAGSGGEPVRIYVEHATVTSSFPAQWQLSVYVPPPLDALRQVDGSSFALGFFMAFEDTSVFGTSDPDTWEPDPDTHMGLAEYHGLLYLPDPVAGDTTLGAYVGGRDLTAGFHLLEGAHFGEKDCSDANNDCWLVSPKGFAVDISVRLGPVVEYSSEGPRIDFFL